MEGHAGAPPSGAEMDLLNPAKLSLHESGESRQRPQQQYQQYDVHHAPSPGLGSTKPGQSTMDEFRSLSLSPAPSARLSPIPRGPYNPLQEHPSLQQQSAVKRFWSQNKCALLVALSQLFGALMNLSARLLELEGEGMHPIQVLFMRQALTTLCCVLYMWYMKVPDFPLGGKDIRLLLVVRGLCGFAGIYGMWYSMMYLPLADATVITFLAPGVAGLVCFFVLREAFTRPEQLATAVALLGVVLIAQPAALFANPAADESSTSEPPESSSGSTPGLDHDTTPEERLIAVGVALIGVCGAAGAFTTLRALGKRTHPLISVNFFSVTCTVICTVVLIFAPLLDIGQPFLKWHNPTSIRQAVLMLILGVFGFTMQYLLTAGLAGDKSNRANSMVYTHMLFAAAFDRWVFGHHMGLTSGAGCVLILGSAVGVVLTKKTPVLKTDDVERQVNLTGEVEGSPMLVGIAGGPDELQLETRR